MRSFSELTLGPRDDAGYPLGGESFTAHDLGAMAVILAGVVIITLAKARATPAAAPVANAPASEPAA